MILERIKQSFASLTSDEEEDGFSSIVVLREGDDFVPEELGEDWKGIRVPLDSGGRIFIVVRAQSPFSDGGEVVS